MVGKKRKCEKQAVDLPGRDPPLSHDVMSQVEWLGECMVNSAISTFGVYCFARQIGVFSPTDVDVHLVCIVFPVRIDRLVFFSNGC